MYFEVWIDLSKKGDVLKKLREKFYEVYEVFYDYHFIVNAESEDEILKVDGVKYVRKHYNC